MWWRRKEVQPVSYPRGPWDSLNAVENVREREPLDMRGLRSMLIDDFLASKTFSAGIYVGTRIKPGLMKTVRHSMDIPKDDLLKVVIDGTWLGSAKNGFVLSSDGLYWKEFWGSPQFANWEALSKSQAHNRLVFEESRMMIDNAVIQMTFGYYAAEDVQNIVTGVLNAFHCSS